MLQRTNDILLSDNLDELFRAHHTENGEWLCLLYCRRGSMQVTINDTRYQVHAHDAVCCLPSFILGEYMRTPDFESDILCVSMTFYRDIMNDCFRREPQWIEKQQYIDRHPIRALDDMQRELLTSYLHLLQVYVRCNQDGYRQEISRSIARAATLEVMSIVETRMAGSGDACEAQGAAAKQTCNDTAVRAFFDLLRRDDYTLQPVQWYANQLHISPKYLSALCKQRTGKTAGDWITRFTVEEAKRLLVHSDDTVKQIAFRLGFADSSFFCQYIRKHTGATPLAIRNNTTKTK